MGCCYSRLDREEVVTRCKARRRYMKELVRARHAFAAAHTMYLRSLRGTGSALLQFADFESQQLRHRHHPQPHFRHHLPPPMLSPPAPPTPPLPPPPPPLSPSSEACTSVTASPRLPPPPPPPPSSWDFWDPFAPSSSRSVTEEEWEATTATVSEVNVSASVAAPPSVVSGYSKDTTTSELAMVVSRNSKDLSEIVKELDEYFLNAANAGSNVSLLLEASSSSFSSQRMTSKVYSDGRNLSPSLWSWRNSKSGGVSSFGILGEEMIRGDLVHGDISASHCSTMERLYAWEKKLYAEVKNAESIKVAHKKRVVLLRKEEAKGADYIKIEKNKKEIEKLQSRLIVASQAMETTSDEIIRLREVELYPQLLELAKALMHMWRSMYECHQVQTHIVQQLKFLNNLHLGTEPTSEIQRQATLQLELEVQQWHSAFCANIKSQRDYIHSLTGWLRLCLFQFSHHPLTKTQQNSTIYALCEEWQLALDRIPDKVASEGIKSFLTVIHSVVVQQAEEQKLKKRSDALFKELDKRVSELIALENKYGPYSSSSSWSGSRKSPVDEKRAKVDALRAKAEDEKTKFEKCSSVTRAMTVNNLQTGFPNVFQAMTGFSSVCTQAFESVQNQPMKNSDQIHDVKRLLM